MRLVEAAFAIAVLAWPSCAASQPQVQLAPGEILLSVEADGETRARPNVMKIDAGVVTTGRTATEATRANAELASRLIAAVHNAGVSAIDVRTRILGVQPRFAGDESGQGQTGNSPPTITGYVARNQLDITFRDLRRGPEILDALLAAGANEVNGPTFLFADPVPQRRAAERHAVASAIAEAENYAAAAGKRVGRMIRISERQAWNDERGSVILPGPNVRTPIEPGEITTRATVFVDFALVDR